MVEEKLNELGIPFTIQGSDYLVKCFNPEHDDNDPSMRIDMHTGVYHCFSCAHKGMLLDSNSTRVLKLSKRIEKMKNKIASIISIAQDMPIGAVPFEVDHRGISAETYKHFKAFTDDSDSVFEGRVVFPITDIDNNILGFQARLLNTKVGAKYVFSPRGITVGMYPVKAGANSIILVEGLFDMLNLWDKGIKNVVCTFGTGISKRKTLLEDFAMFKLQGVTKVFILFDGDDSGRSAAVGLEERLEKEFVVTRIDLGDDEDPGSMNMMQVQKLKKLLT